MAFTIPAISSTKTPAQIKANYVALMGPQAGEAFAELMQDAARLHLKWNEFLALFAVGPAQIDTLNKAAPGFFYLVSGVVERPNPAHLPYDRRQQEGPVARDPHEASPGGYSSWLRTEAETRPGRLKVLPTTCAT